MSADTDHQVVLLPRSLEELAKIEFGRSETGQMVSHQFAVEVDAGTIHCLMDLEPDRFGNRPLERESPAVPERLTVPPASFGAHFGKCRLRKVDEPWHRNLVIESLWRPIHVSLGDRPGSVQGNGPPRGRRGTCR